MIHPNLDVKLRTARLLLRPLGAEHRGRGLTTEAARRVLSFAFGELRPHKVHVAHVGDNNASKALIRRLGMRYVGTQREGFRKDGRWHDQFLYETRADELGIPSIETAELRGERSSDALVSNDGITSP